MRFVRPSLARIHAGLVGHPRVISTLVLSLAVFLFFGGGALAWFSYDVTSGLPDKNELRGLGDMAQATTIYDASDKPVFTIFKEQRIEVPFERISPHLIKAVLSVEDQRFYDHRGIDAVRVAAAAIRNVQEGRRAEGGSTITQQLARQSFLTRDKTYRRKAKEVILAAYIENLYEKQDILELYLNKVYFGDGFYGVEAASRGYFAKPAAELSVEEAALLAGLIQSPSSYAPTVNLERAVARRNIVLQAMVSSGALDAPTAERLKKAKVELKNGLEVRETFGLYFKEEVRKALVERFGWERVYQGGLRVYTTMNTDLQLAAEEIVEEGLVDIEKRRGFKHPKRNAHEPKAGQLPEYLQGALVSIDATNGDVLALVGGRNFRESRFNRTTQAKRQSGSAFKPFVYAAALEAGYSPASVVTGLNEPIDTLQGKWVPEDEHNSANSMTLRQGLKTSSNRAAVQLLQDVGIANAVSYAEKMQVGTPPSVPSLALGTSDVTLLSLTSAYGAFATGGLLRPAVMIRRVEDNDGKVLYSDPRKSERVVSEATAFMMSSMLADVVNHGTGYRARQSGFTLPAAGKTGTTNDYVDAWFVGFTPRVVTGVWVGFDQPSTIIANGYGGELAVPIWATFMKAATKGHKADWYDKPDDVVGVTVCRITGKLPNAGCSNIHTVTPEGWSEWRSALYTEYFKKGTQPTSLCPLHAATTYITEQTAAEEGLAPARAAVGASAPPPPVPTTGSPAPSVAPPAPARAAAKPEDPPKKRGFWSRLFGRGKNEQKKPDDTKKKPGGGGAF
jgi:1A family penicillin-binding protein